VRSAYRPRFVALAMTLAGLVLWWADGTPLEATQQAAGADFDSLLQCAAGLACWLILGWLALALLIEHVAALPGAADRLAGRAARSMSPQVLRRLTQGILGISLIAGPMAASPALAAGGSSTSRPAPGTTVAPLSLDRPSAATPATGAVISLPSLDRPLASAAADPPVVRYVAPAPRHQPTRPTGPDASSLLTGTAHRATTDQGYTVRRGDALWDITARHLGPHATATEIARAWPRWYSANRAVIGADPDLLIPGEVLYAPST
jgi:hypothetical protein